jgi:hypothetical protein
MKKLFWWQHQSKIKDQSWRRNFYRIDASIKLCQRQEPEISGPTTNEKEKKNLVN